MGTDTKLLIGHKVRAVREMKGFSQDFLADQMGISQNAVSKIEKGEIKLDFEKACEIAEFLGVDINTLVNFDANNIFQHCSQFGVYNTTIHTESPHLEKLIEAKDQIITEKEERIKMLEATLKSK